MWIARGNRGIVSIEQSRIDTGDFASRCLGEWNRSSVGENDALPFCLSSISIRLNLSRTEALASHSNLTKSSSHFFPYLAFPYGLESLPIPGGWPSLSRADSVDVFRRCAPDACAFTQAADENPERIRLTHTLRFVHPSPVAGSSIFDFHLSQ
jgi:hypothetical protein